MKAFLLSKRANVTEKCGPEGPKTGGPLSFEGDLKALRCPQDVAIWRAGDGCGEKLV